MTVPRAASFPSARTRTVDSFTLAMAVVNSFPTARLDLASAQPSDASPTKATPTNNIRRIMIDLRNPARSRRVG
jgi:hypothetical protein